MATRWDRYYERQMKDPEMKELVEKELQDLHLGIQLARLRQGEGLNQTSLAARAGMNASKISVIEKSPRNVTLGTLIRLAHALGKKVKINFVPEERRYARAIAHKRR